MRTKDLEAIGLPRQYPRMMVKEGLLELVGYGVYRAPQSEGTEGSGPAPLPGVSAMARAVQEEEEGRDRVTE